MAVVDDQEAATSVLTFVVAGLVFVSAVGILFVSAGQLITPATIDAHGTREVCRDSLGQPNPTPTPGSNCFEAAPAPSSAVPTTTPGG